MSATTKALGAALILGTAVHGFAKGVSSTSNFHDNFYNIALGDPNADQAVFGGRLNPMEFMAPLPAMFPTAYNVMSGRTPGRMLGAPAGGLLGGATGTVVGGVVGGLIGTLKGKGLKGGLIGGVVGGLGGSAIGAGMGLSGNRSLANMGRLGIGIKSGLINGTMVGDYFRGNNNGLSPMNDPTVNAYRNTPPRVDGSLVFGAYNSRYGG